MCHPACRLAHAGYSLSGLVELPDHQLVKPEIRQSLKEAQPLKHATRDYAPPCRTSLLGHVRVPRARVLYRDNFRDPMVVPVYRLRIAQSHRQVPVAIARRQAEPPGLSRSGPPWTVPLTVARLRDILVTLNPWLGLTPVSKKQSRAREYRSGIGDDIRNVVRGCSAVSGSEPFAPRSFPKQNRPALVTERCWSANW